MKKLLISLFSFLAFVFVGIALAAPTSTIVQNLIVSSGIGGGTLCAQFNNQGLLVSSTAPCGTGSGGGSVSTSSPINQFNFPYWATVAGGLSGTSTAVFSPTLFQILSLASTTQFRTPSSTLGNLTINAETFNDLTGNGLYISSNALNASGSIPLSRLGLSTYSTVQNLFDFSMSPGQSSGGVISVNATGTVNVSAGTGFIKASDSNVATLSFTDWAASNTISVATNTTRYLGVSYYSGTPAVISKSADSWDLDTEFPLGTVVNESGSPAYILNNPWITADNQANITERFDSLAYVSRDNRTGGLTLSATGTRQVVVSSGNLLSRMSEFAVGSLDTSGTSTFDGYYRDGSGGLTKQSSQTQWNNSQYDDGTGTLASLSLLNYTSRWYYECTDNSLVMIYGRAQYATLAGALNDGTPSSAPDRVTKMCILIGRFIIQNAGTSPSITQSAFGTAFTAASVSNHSDLAGLTTGDDHTQYLLLAGRSGGQTSAGALTFTSSTVFNASAAFNGGLTFTTATGTSATSTLGASLFGFVNATGTNLSVTTLKDSQNNQYATSSSFGIQVGAARNGAPADNSTYYVSASPQGCGSVTTSTLCTRIVIPVSGYKIVSAWSSVLVNGQLGTTENVTSTIVINDATTVFTLSNSSWNVVSTTLATATGTGVNVNQFDYVNLKWQTPGWVTNPTNVDATWGIGLRSQ